MARFRPGQLVKKVRGGCFKGVVCTVVGYEADPSGRTLCVQPHQSGKGYRNWKNVQVSAWEKVYAFDHEFEPILAQHQPCDADFKESLDQLLGEHA